MSFLDDERLVDLLVQQATSGLVADEFGELERLLAVHPDADPEAIERTVVALALAAREQHVPLPGALRHRLLARWSAVGSDAIASVPRIPRQGTAGWWAAAAAVVLALIGWYPRHAAAPAGIDPQAERARLLASVPGVLRWEFASTDDPAAHGAGGDVVWDGRSQRGFLRLRGLAPNDPRASQYQLWIFDADRDARYPVDGGVFDIPAGAADVIIPIRAGVPVGKAALFAVTVERPGGVVVSGRERIVVLAKPAST